MDLLKDLEKYASDAAFQSKWQSIKQINKKRFIDLVKKNCNVDLDE